MAAGRLLKKKTKKMAAAVKRKQALGFHQASGFDRRPARADAHFPGLRAVSAVVRRRCFRNPYRLDHENQTRIVFTGSVRSRRLRHFSTARAAWENRQGGDDA